MSSVYVPLDGSLQSAFQNIKQADMTIQCQDGSVPVHRSVLAAASPFLRPLLQDTSALQPTSIVMADVSEVTMQQVLSLMYTGQAYSRSIPHLQEVLAAAKLLGMDLGTSWEIVNSVIVPKAGSGPGSPILLSTESDSEPQIVEETRRKKLKPKPCGRLKPGMTSETALVIGEMLESGQLELMPGPGFTGFQIMGQGVNRVPPAPQRLPRDPKLTARPQGPPPVMPPLLPAKRFRIQGPLPIPSQTPARRPVPIQPVSGFKPAQRSPELGMVVRNIDPDLKISIQAQNPGTPALSKSHNVKPESPAFGPEVIPLTQGGVTVEESLGAFGFTILSEEEVQEQFQVASRKDHAYAGASVKRKRAKTVVEPQSR